MASISFNALRSVTSIHGREYVMYSTFITPNKLIEFSSVPSYEIDAEHHDISSRLREPPVSKWQRPMDFDRVRKLRKNIDRANPDTNDDDTLMANPVLLGRSDKIGRDDVQITIEPLLTEFGMQRQVVQDVYKITLHRGRGHDKPLWILDGQHRIHGLGESNHLPPNNSSILANQKIPVVLVLDENFTSKFLAKIFTEVTTKAEPMDHLHQDWMQYSFRFAEYKNPAAQKAMRVVIELNSTQVYDNAANPFFNRIQFNPNGQVSPIGPITAWTAIAARKLFEKHFFDDNFNDFDANIVASAFVRYYRAMRELDGHSDGYSKLTGNGGMKKVLTTFWAYFLNFLRDNPDRLHDSSEDWCEFLDSGGRKFSSSDWTLPGYFVGANETNRARKASDKALTITLEKFYYNPQEFGGLSPTQYLFSAGEIDIQFGDYNIERRRFNPNNLIHVICRADGGNPQPLQEARVNGKNGIRFKSISSDICEIISLEIRDQNNFQVWNQMDITKGIELPMTGDYLSIFRVTTQAFSEGSKQQTTFQILS